MVMVSWVYDKRRSAKSVWKKKCRRTRGFFNQGWVSAVIRSISKPRSVQWHLTRHNLFFQSNDSDWNFSQTTSKSWHLGWLPVEKNAYNLVLILNAATNLMYSIRTYLATLGFLGGTILLFLQAEISASDTSWMTGMLPCTNRTPSTSPICRMPWLRLPPGLCRGGTGPWPWGGGDWRAAKILERCS